jgi:hypothetical protein
MACETHHPFAAVLTGDIVKSRGLTDRALSGVMDTLADSVSDIGKDLGLHAGFARYRGDGWQAFLPEGAPALRAALRLIAALTARHKGAATRMTIGLGAADLPPDRALGAASGAAFVTSGDLLAAQERWQRLTLAPRAGQALCAVTQLLDWQARQWTAPQAEALFEALRIQTPTQEEIAARIGGVTRQAIQIRLSGTGLPAIQEALHVFESTVADLWTRTAPA